MRKHVVASWLVAIALLSAGPASAQSPDAIAAAKELIIAMRAADQIKASFPLIMQQFKPVIAQGNPAVERDYRCPRPGDVERDGRPHERASRRAWRRSTRGSSPTEEIKQIAGFYRAPVGQKFLQIMPSILQESMAVGQKFGQEVAAEAQKQHDRGIAQARAQDLRFWTPPPPKPRHPGSPREARNWAVQSSSS